MHIPVRQATAQYRSSLYLVSLWFARYTRHADAVSAFLKLYMMALPVTLFHPKAILLDGHSILDHDFRLA